MKGQGMKIIVVWVHKRKGRLHYEYTVNIIKMTKKNGYFSLKKNGLVICSKLLISKYMKCNIFRSLTPKKKKKKVWEGKRRY
jgi:hypothetical protein